MSQGCGSCTDCSCRDGATAVIDKRGRALSFARDLADQPTLIGLTGHYGSGKDESARLLAHYGYERVAFADPLKRIATVLGWDGDKSEKPACPCCGMLQGRALLQVLGTEGVRESIRQDAWLLAAEAAIAKRSKVVITDVRFENEAEFVRRHGGEIWRVIRPGHAGNGHVSETDIEKIVADRVVLNDGSLGELEERIQEMLGWRK